MRLELGVVVQCPHCGNQGTVGQIVTHEDPRISQDRILIVCPYLDERRQVHTTTEGTVQTVNHNVSLTELVRSNDFHDL